MKAKKLCSLLLAVVLTAGMALTGCQKSSKSDQASDSSKLDPVTLKLVVAGDQPPEQQEVLDKISEKSKDELNVTLDVMYIPWSDYQEKVKMMAASGDEFDLFLNFGFDAVNAYTRKQAIGLNELMDKYGQDIKKNIPDLEFAPFLVDGETVAIPAVYVKDSINTTIIIRKDLREKYNVPEVKDVETFKQYLEAIKKNEPNMIPYGCNATQGGTAFLRSTEGFRPTMDSSSVAMWYIDGEDGKMKAFNRYREGGMDYQVAQLFEDFYANGYLEKDLLSQKDSEGLFEAGKVAAYNVDLFKFSKMEANLKNVNPDAEVEYCIMNPDQPIAYDKSNNTCQISSTSKNPERAMMFINWVLKNQENYDLYMYGIEGKHYTLENELLKLPDGVDAGNNPYAPTPWLFYNTNYHRATTEDSEITLQALEYFKNQERYPVDEEALGFNFDPDPVALEIGQCQKVVEEEWNPIGVGIRPIDEAYDQFMTDLKAAGGDKIVEEAQRQIDAYYESLGK